MVATKHLKRVAEAVGIDLRIFHPQQRSRRPRNCFYSSDFFVPSLAASPVRWRMMSDDHRRRMQSQRAHAAEELTSIEEGAFGRGWRVRERVAYLEGFLRGSTARLNTDTARRN